MNRPIAVVGAPSSIGIRPYDDGLARHLDTAPHVLRQRGLIARLGATDMGLANVPSKEKLNGIADLLNPNPDLRTRWRGIDRITEQIGEHLA